MQPGLRLRQARERLGLTYRDVERASYELAARRGRPDFILHISRLADIENRGVVPGLHKLYTLAAIYRLNPLEIFGWYDVPIEECFHDGTSFPAPRTHLMAAPASLRIPMKFDPAFDPRKTEFLLRMVPSGRLAAGDAAASAIALFAGDVARAGRSGNRGPGDGRSYAPDRAGERCSSRISRRARRFEQKRTLR